MTSGSTARATLDDLYGVDGKAELIGGRIVHQMASGVLPSVVAGEIFVSLRAYSRAAGRGTAFPDGIGYSVPELPSERESFSPDASYHMGVWPRNQMRFMEGPPTFAAEVRTENDYGAAAEAQIEAKRADYFAAGTAVVWDVDPNTETVKSYRAAEPNSPIVFRRGDIAHAEPAVPGWRMAVADLFPV